MRCFIAVDIPENLKEPLIEMQKQLSDTGNKLKLVSVENMHITLNFLGDVDHEEVIEKIGELKFKEFEIRLKSLHTFPNKDFIRVIAVGTDPIGDLKDIYEQITLKLGKSDSSSFTPHLTLARLKDMDERENIVKFINQHIDFESDSFKVSKVKLYKSEPHGPSGPKYTLLREFNATDNM